MLRARTAWLPAVAAAAAVAGLVAWLGAGALPGTSGPAGAQEKAHTLVVTGIRIGPGQSPRTLVRLRNCTRTESYSVHYTVQSVDGEPLSLPGAGPAGAPLLAGRTLDLDLGLIVAQYRAQFEVGPFTGEARLVAYAEGGVVETFGPDTVHASALQVESPARLQPLVEWR